MTHSAADSDMSTGIEALDGVLGGLQAGDNVVWQVPSVAEYAAFAIAFVEGAVRRGQRLTYFRFARHAPLLGDGAGAAIVRLDPHAGFEPFLDAIRSRIAEQGPGACYLFDCLSDLTADWNSDQMLGNFFLLTCPYLYRYRTLAYFAIFRDMHSHFAMEPILRTTQVFVDIYRHEGRLYLQPMKVEDRRSPDMYTLHLWEGDAVRPVQASHTAAGVLRPNPPSTLGVSQYHLGVWTRTFVHAESLLELERIGAATPETVDAMFQRLLRMVVTRDRRVFELARRYLTLADLVALGRRMLGTGLIGGKSVGMLLARAILRADDARWEGVVEEHDSFYVPSDIFYTFLVRNGCWAIRNRQLKARGYSEEAAEARERILTGTFPPHIEQRFAAMLDYFGQSPIIVRSSSLLEDNFGNSFAGKYDSYFLTSQGTPAQRFEAFADAVRAIYASTMSREALSYRARHGLLGHDEQMALLVQRVSGTRRGALYYPHAAGVGFSFNPYVWSRDIDPAAGMLRLVFGLGTRAVDRTDDDYTRLVALNAPERRPEQDASDTPRHAQQKVDVLDCDAGQLDTRRFRDLAAGHPPELMRLFASRDPALARRARETGMPAASALQLTFDRLLAGTAFVRDMRDLLRVLQEAYAYPVDVEFTVNFDDTGRYRINLVQCRPLQVKGGEGLPERPDVPRRDVLLETRGPVIGQSRAASVDRVVYVVPHLYAALPERDRHAVARLIGRVNRHTRPGQTVLLAGPGRWGTTTPSLGVPVDFSEIDRVATLCEIVAMRDDLVPDVSFGTHFFSELVELEMLYVAVVPGQEGHYLNRALLEERESRLPALEPDAGALAEVVRVIDTPAGHPIRLWADTLTQDAVCYWPPG